MIPDSHYRPITVKQPLGVEQRETGAGKGGGETMRRGCSPRGQKTEAQRSPRSRKTEGGEMQQVEERRGREK